MKNLSIFIIIILAAGLYSCEELFENKVDNTISLEEVLEDASKIRGLLDNAYKFPNTHDHFGDNYLDCATDNAVTNNLSSGINRMVEGAWLPSTNPLDNWSTGYKYIRQVNEFMENYLKEGVWFYKSSEIDNENIKIRSRGEVFFLRAYHHFDLLRRFAGKGPDGTMLGIPVLTKSYSFLDVPDLPRNTYEECVQQIIDDCDSAVVYLPEIYTGSDRVYGTSERGRATINAALALKARTLLYAASPLYSEGLTELQKQDRWEKAAHASMELINNFNKTLPNVYDIGTPKDPFRGFFNDPENGEVIMRRMEQSRNPEIRSFPPSHYGSGRTNPSQNLVDAFGMSNGYPITHESYDPNNPYENRDPRLFMTVLYNGAEFKGREVETFEGGIDMPGFPGVDISNSTRTGYYLRKWLSTTASNVSPNFVTDYHYYSLFRKGEVFLNFAEAANEAYGPDSDPDGLGYTAKEALLEVRRRANIDQPDEYLEEVSASKDDFRELVRNERRVELCFEDHRFFDIRRWMVPNLNVPVEGMRITKEESGDFTYNRFVVLTSNYDDHMYFGPLPFDEVLKMPLIEQNQGW